MLLKVASYVVLSVATISLAGLIAFPYLNPGAGEYLQPVQIEVNDLYEKDVVPSPTASLEDDREVKNPKAKKVITLQEKNVVALRGPVTGESVAKVMAELQKKSLELSKSTPIYLFIDSPGGSVFAGLDLIDFADGLPQPIHTITLFSASMAFQTVQALDKRYILRQGTLMSHRGAGGVSGQFDGELESRYRMIKRKLDYMDYVASKRMEMSLDDYKDMITNEYWVHGFDAVEEKAADTMVLARCGKSMKGTEKEEFMTFFGKVTVTFSKCPLISAPLEVDFGKIEPKNKKYIQHVFDLALNKKEKYVEKFVVTGKYRKVFAE